MNTEIPQQIGPYHLVSELGRGGMGVVYLARDTRLDRDVAIKSLPVELASDPARLERFEREARTLASLNHPNLAGIHGVEEQGGARYLVLEYVDGETLADRLDRGAIPADEALEFAQQICAGVEAAHDAGVIHRDLKPANIKVTSEGVVKVLDFGLARADDGMSSSGAGLDSPTLTTPVMNSPTIAGAILGTAPYMSPEQARGRRVDKRTDIWSFGVVLYEMLTGIGPFHGETATDSIGAILHKDVDLARLPAGTPAQVRRVLKRCLARDKQERYRDIGDVRIELEAEGEESVGAVQSSSRVLVGVLGVALLAALVGLGVVLFGGQTPRLPVMRVALQPPADSRIMFSGDLAGPPVISPDGTKVVYAAAGAGVRQRLWLQEFGEVEPRGLDGTEGALFPFWSPDGREVGFFTIDYLWRFDIASGTVRRVCSVNQSRGGAWTEDGRIIFAQNFRGGLFQVDADGGEITPLTVLDEALHTSHRWPSIIPGTEYFLFIAVTSRAGEWGNNGIYLGSLDSGEPPVRVIACDYSAEYIDGHLLHVRDGVLLATRFDPEEGELRGNPIVIARDVAADLSTWHGQFSASTNGHLVFSRQNRDEKSGVPASGYSSAVEGNRITAYTYEGRETTAYARGMSLSWMSLSPDGITIAMSALAEDGYFDIWTQPTAWSADGRPGTEIIRSSVHSPELSRITFLPGQEVVPVWSPDGTEIAFRWDGDDTRPRGIYRKRVGGGSEVLVYDGIGGDAYAADWTPDGEYIIAVSGTLAVSENNDLWAIPVDGGDLVPLVQQPGPDFFPQVSPDGRWLIYNESREGRTNAYVVPFAPAWPEGAPSAKWLVSENGGRVPRWSREGDEIYYLSDAAVLIARSVEISDDQFSFSAPRALFQTRWDIGQSYDVTPDGLNGFNSFLFMENTVTDEKPISVIVNWPELLKESSR